MTVPKRQTMIAIALAVVVAAGILLAAAITARFEPATQGVMVGSSKDNRWQAVAPGRVEPRSGQIKVSAAVAGLVDKVLVRVNNTVFAGEPLIQLSGDEFKARLAAAEAQVAIRKRAQDGQPATGRAGDRREAKDAVTDAERAVYDARSAVDRAVSEWRAGLEPHASVTVARSGLARAQDELTKRQEELRKIEANSPSLTSLEGQLSIARADHAVARAALDKLTIRAPIDGTVLQVNVRVGELATPGTLLLLLADLSGLRVRAELDERDLGSIRVGQTVSVRPAAFPGRDFEGRVSSIAPLVEHGRLDVRELRTQSDVDVVEVMIEMAQPGPLAVGMKADVYFHLEGTSAENRRGASAP